MKTLVTFTILFSLQASASQYDKVQELNGVLLKSLKEESSRIYIGGAEKILRYPLDLVIRGVTNFSDKCNNSHKSKRRYTSQEKECRYHNENLIETFVLADIRKMDDFKEVSEAYVLGRHVYNRGDYGYYELVTVRNTINDKGQKTTTITLRMLQDKEARLYITPKFPRESPFKTSLGIFKLTQRGPDETHLSYEYTASTDHWLLNKVIVVPQVFSSISKSINDMIKTVEEESSWQKRELASQE